MAVRDRNVAAWQAYVITLTIVSVLLLGIIGFMFFTGSTNSKMAEDATKTANDARGQVAQLASKIQVYEAMLGHKQYSDAEFGQLLNGLSGDVDIESVKQAYERDMALIGPDVAAQDRSYSRLGSYLMQALRDRNLQVEAQAKDLIAKNNEVETIRETETALRVAAETEQEKLENELSKVNQDYLEQSNARQAQLDTLKNQLTKTSQENEDRLRKINSELQSIKSENNQLASFNRELQEEIAETIEREDFESAQGRILNTSGTKIAWINLGTRDGLRKGLIFSVLPQDTIRISEAKPKGLVEVVDVTDSNARVRVMDTEYKVPVIEGDLVYSPTWNIGGRQVEYALLGRMDLDGNGSDDTDLLRSLIERNGGKVVEQVGPDGTVSRNGEGLNIRTRYLVIGDRPSVTADGVDTRTTDLMSKYGELESKADKYNIAKIAVEKLVASLRGNGERIVALGTGTRAGDVESTRPRREMQLTPYQQYQAAKTQQREARMKGRQ